MLISNLVQLFSKNPYSPRSLIPLAGHNLEVTQSVGPILSFASLDNTRVWTHCRNFHIHAMIIDNLVHY